MDDKSYSETNANSETAPATPAGAMTVTATGTKDKDKFTGCYFTVDAAGTTWSLYNKNGNLLTTGQTSGESTFQFQHDKQAQNSQKKITWTITDFSWTTTNGITRIAGSWSNDDDPNASESPQSGSFQASSGGGIDAVSASA